MDSERINRKDRDGVERNEEKIIQISGIVKKVIIGSEAFSYVPFETSSTIHFVCMLKTTIKDPETLKGKDDILTNNNRNKRNCFIHLFDKILFLYLFFPKPTLRDA